jgi:predicted AlkP superfamily pyrophosphatase or phosphodiesterase
MKKGLLFYLLALLFISCAQPDKQPKVLLVSFDGFRADYLTKTETPHFDTFVEEGVLAEGMIPVFPSNTFPNHYSIATGLYPENTGLIDNSFYAPDLGQRYSMGNREAVEDGRFYFGEPIWNTVEKQGLKAGTMFWVGSEADIQGMHPTHWKKYDGSVPDSARIDTVVKWLSTDSDFATLYFSFVDGIGHTYGSESAEIVAAIQRADSLVGYLMQELEAKGIGDTEVIILSDHGMYEVSDERIIFLDDYINPDYVEWVMGSKAVFLAEKERPIEDVYNDLKEGKNFKAYLKPDIPDRYHLKNSDRVPELLLVSDLGYIITSRDYYRGNTTGASHGFDNQEEAMWAFFAAKGPSFKVNYKAGVFENVHVYELMNHLLGTEPAPNDGSLDSVKVMLK